MVERPVASRRVIYERAAGRLSSPEEGQKRAAYNALQRNKESIALNLKEPEAQQIFCKLAESADVVVEVEAPGLPGGAVSQEGIPIRLSETPGRVRFPGSVTGHYTAQVLAGQGYTGEQVKDLRQRGVLE